MPASLRRCGSECPSCGDAETGLDQGCVSCGSGRGERGGGIGFCDGRCRDGTFDLGCCGGFVCDPRLVGFREDVGVGFGEDGSVGDAFCRDAVGGGFSSESPAVHEGRCAAGFPCECRFPRSADGLPGGCGGRCAGYARGGVRKGGFRKGTGGGCFAGADDGSGGIRVGVEGRICESDLPGRRSRGRLCASWNLSHVRGFPVIGGGSRSCGFFDVGF